MFHQFLPCFTSFEHCRRPHLNWTSNRSSSNSSNNTLHTAQQRTATHNNTQQHTTTHNNTPQHTTTHHNTHHTTPQHTTTHHNTTQHNTTQHNTTQHNTTHTTQHTTHNTQHTTHNTQHTTHSQQPTTTTTIHKVHRSTFLFRVNLTGACMWANVDVAHARGAAWRRRQRRLRAHWRHEQLTLQMLLATYEHHAATR